MSGWRTSEHACCHPDRCSMFEASSKRRSQRWRVSQLGLSRAMPLLNLQSWVAPSFKGVVICIILWSEILCSKASMWSPRMFVTKKSINLFPSHREQEVLQGGTLQSNCTLIVTIQASWGSWLKSPQNNLSPFQLIRMSISSIEIAWDLRSVGDGGQ